ncbi:hypothetical protein BDW74DRAFT_169689 [Aspergillus multicolor]|uniref:uncharacterized protein n=1 Tax=Aspergillus multicolor TaxID=41759 RepID=UPI003CCD24CF
MSKTPKATTVKETELLLYQNLKGLFLTGKFSDMKSKFFNAALNANFKTVDLPEDNLETNERALSFLYFTDYKPDSHVMDLDKLSARNASEKPAPEDNKDQAGIAYSHIGVYVAADKYGISPLKKLAAKNFGDWCKKNSKASNFLDVCKDALSSVPAHDSHIRQLITDVIIHNVIGLAKGSPDKVRLFLETHPFVASEVVCRLVMEDKVWGSHREEGVAELINHALWKECCGNCPYSDDEFRVRMELGDLEK